MISQRPNQVCCKICSNLTVSKEIKSNLCTHQYRFNIGKIKFVLEQSRPVLKDLFLIGSRLIFKILYNHLMKSTADYLVLLS